jgi:hypothetical protein
MDVGHLQAYVMAVGNGPPQLVDFSDFSNHISGGLLSKTRIYRPEVLLAVLVLRFPLELVEERRFWFVGTLGCMATETVGGRRAVVVCIRREQVIDSSPRRFILRVVFIIHGTTANRTIHVHVLVKAHSAGNASLADR